MDDDATDGQMADYLAADLSGDNGAWNIGIVEYQCLGCMKTIEVISDELKDYRALVIRWHQKAEEGDYFSRFVFEYLAFIAHIRNNIFIGATTDRRAIQLVKQNAKLEKAYLQAIMSEKPLRKQWQSVIEELARHPLYNTSKDLDFPELDVWWNSVGNNVDKENKSKKGIVNSLTDWGNMVEFWYSVRNNLFHGTKDPNIKRDCFLVEHAYRTLAIFMNNEIEALPDENY
ncbi:hypothetical protein [Sideroxydans sp.]